MDRDVEKIIYNRWPHLYTLFITAPASKGAILFTDTPEPAPIYEGLQLCSGYDRIREARMQATLLPEDASEATIYGIVKEDLPTLLLARQSLLQLNIVVLNLSLAFSLLTSLSATAWLEDPRVSLYYGGEETSLRFPFTVIPPCLQCADTSAARISDLTLLELSTYHLNQKFKQQKEETLRTRLQAHIPFIRQDGDVASLFTTKNKSTFLVAGAGPTLSKSIDLLRRLRQEHELIAVDAALSLLLEQDIVPDFVVTIDPQKTILKFFTPFDERLTKTKLIYFPVVETDVLALWKGKRYTAYPSTGEYTDFVDQYPKGTLFSAGSVIHPSVDLAIKMGATSILLFGADFSFPDAATHAEGCILRKKIDPNNKYRTVINGSGGLVSSQANLIGYLRDLEVFIERHSSINFVNTSREGAMINGTTYYPNA
jgi:hypothetical protein